MKHRERLLEVQGLTVQLDTPGGTLEPVRDLSLHVDRGEILGLVGESGAGKSLTAHAILGVLQPPGRIAAGEILWKGQTTRGEHGKTFAHQVRGKEISIILQDAMSALDPVFTIGTQITEVLHHHLHMTRRQALTRAAELLELVGITSPHQRLRQYPHELSGGMLQRVAIVMALACEPELLIADEPTTGLDVNVQAQILDLCADLQQRLAFAALLITHDIGVTARLCDRVNVMYAGRIVENGTALEMFDRPAHPYTIGLLRSTPRLDARNPQLLSIEGDPPELQRVPSGCAFHPRCPGATGVCAASAPRLATVGALHEAACWHPFSDKSRVQIEAHASHD